MSYYIYEVIFMSKETLYELLDQAENLCVTASKELYANNNRVTFGVNTMLEALDDIMNSGEFVSMRNSKLLHSDSHLMERYYNVCLAYEAVSNHISGLFEEQLHISFDKDKIVHICH